MMKTLFTNQKVVVSILTMLLLLYGVQGISYADEIPTVALRVIEVVTEGNADGAIVRLLLEGGTWENIGDVRGAVTVSGSAGVTLQKERYTYTYRCGFLWLDTCRGVGSRPAIRRVSDTVLEVPLEVDNQDFNADVTLTFSVAAGAIANYEGTALTAEISTDSIGRIFASVVSPLTERTLNGSTVTLTLGKFKLTPGPTYAYEADVATIRDAVTVSGINGVTIDATTIQRLSDTEITVELDFDDTDFDTDTALSFSVEAGAIANYTGDAFITEIVVIAYKESLSASVAFPLTEGTLNGSTVTLLLTGAAFEQDISKIRDGVTVSGINGVTVDTATVQRLSDRKITVELDFDGPDFVRNRALTFSVASGAITNYKGTALTTEIPVTANKGELLLKIFWTDRSTDKIQRANLDGSDVQDLVTQGLERPSGIALDLEGGKMYWTDHSTEKIQRANLDGSDVQDLVIRTQGLSDPRGIALDVEGGKMYWTDYGTDKIQRANLDGSDVQDLVTRTQGLVSPRGIALDVAGGKMYWTDYGTDKIQRANLDGSDVQDLVTRTQGLSDPIDIALDVEGGKMYWTDTGTDKIQRANLDGSDVQDLITQGLVSPSGIALDVAGGKMYWTDYGTDKIQRANLDGSNIEDLVKGLSRPNGIAIGIFSPVNLTIVVEDANSDGVVDVQDIVYIGQRYGQSGQSSADVNKDGVVNIDDLILVAAVIDNAPAAPSLRSQIPKGLTAAVVNQWLTEAKLTPQNTLAYQRGVRFLEQLLAALTPKETSLLANFPNPFNPETWMPYHLSKDADVTLHIYAVNGTLVRTLTLGHQPAGMYQSRSRAAYWDGRNAFGEPVASGVYFYTLTAGDFSATRKMLIRK